MLKIRAVSVFSCNHCRVFETPMCWDHCRLLKGDMQGGLSPPPPKKKPRPGFIPGIGQIKGRGLWGCFDAMPF